MFNIQTATSEQMSKLLPYLKVFSSFNEKVYRLTKGRVLGKLAGYDICLVTMTGAKSGKKRVLPLMYVPHKEGVIIVASQGGAPRNPAWFNNLVVNPDIEVQYKAKKMQLRARRVNAQEKAEVWPTCCKYYPDYDLYQKRTDRDIPVFVCEPR